MRETIDPLAANAEPTAILALRVVDPAMGSGHFLIGAARRLAVHLLAAYRRLAERDGEEALPPALQRAWDDEAESLTLCRQLVAVHCLYGVDKNPLAVDLARVALWLATAAAGHPLSFLDHRLRCGDSLLWLPLERVVSLADLRASARKRGRKNGAQFELLETERTLVNEIDLQKAVDTTLAAAFERLGDFLAVVDDEREPFEAKRAANERVRAVLAPLFVLHVARVGRLLRDDERTGPLLDAFGAFARNGLLDDTIAGGLAPWLESAATVDPFAWELEFPEVFFACDARGSAKRRADAGFDVVLGNPPWDKLKIDRKNYYVRYDPLLLDYQGASVDSRIAVIDAHCGSASDSFTRSTANATQYVC
ncbi:MAG: Eco57I restriction-modification methylase domain-containing protein, partial [Candidatus Dormibacteria bacterium]